jgi:protein pelota
MRVRHFKEESKLKIEDLDDLWYLKSVLESGDIVSASTYRRVKDDTKARADKGQRVRVFLGVRLEDSDYSEHSKTLRLTGQLTESSDPNIGLGSYHTLDIGVGDTVTVQKAWKRWQLDRLREAEESSKVGRVLIVSVEDGEADFAVLRKFGIHYAFRVTKSLGGKDQAGDYTVNAADFYDVVSAKIGEMKKSEGVSAAIVCGPGFAKDKVFERLKTSKVEGIFLEPAGCGGRAAIQEVLKRGAVEKIVEESKVAVETRLVEELFSRIAVSGAAAYGPGEVERAAGMSAIETLLVTYTYLQKHHPDKLLEKVKQGRGEIHVVSPEHDAGERLDAISGIGALLRFPIS